MPRGPVFGHVSWVRSMNIVWVHPVWSKPSFSPNFLHFPASWPCFLRRGWVNSKGHLLGQIVNTLFQTTTTGLAYGTVLVHGHAAQSCFSLVERFQTFWKGRYFEPRKTFSGKILFELT